MILLKRLRVLIAAALLLISAPLLYGQAQNEQGLNESQDESQNESGPGGQSSQQQDGNAETEEATDDTDMPDIDSQPIERAEGQGPGRFIPSEQISQDFGVSFPVDI